MSAACIAVWWESNGGTILHRAVQRCPHERCTPATGTRSCHDCLAVLVLAEDWTVARPWDCLGSTCLGDGKSQAPRCERKRESEQVRQLQSRDFTQPTSDAVNQPPVTTENVKE